MFFNVNLFYVNTLTAALFGNGIYYSRIRDFGRQSVKMMMAVVVMIVGQYYETYKCWYGGCLVNSRDNVFSWQRISLFFSHPFCYNVGTTGKKIPNFSGTACSIVELYRQMYSAVNNHYSLNSIFAFFIMSNEKFGKPRIHFHKLTESKLKDLLFRKHEKNEICGKLCLKVWININSILIFTPLHLDIGVSSFCFYYVQ